MATRFSWMKFCISPLLLAVFLFLTSTVYAQQDVPDPSDDEVNAIAKELYCPVCENVPLDVCGTQACAQWRDLIREHLSQGWNEAQIKEYFVTQYGDRVLASPPARGLNWLAYLVPPVAFLIGVFIVVSALRAWKSETKPVTDVAGQQDSDDEYIARLEEELKRTQ